MLERLTKLGDAWSPRRFALECPTQLPQWSGNLGLPAPHLGKPCRFGLKHHAGVEQPALPQQLADVDLGFVLKRQAGAFDILLAVQAQGEIPEWHSLQAGPQNRL
ncbi:hypothetical protein SAMN04487955_11532 [Halomonas korlensis]|uniref:Uncharacterized protein n=1 Tax=Halomonas korlensis TaxID=463301 RepID=A0A1I7K6M8_9GAMM|nr:hypothetical protein SAMN04487955_11532 [Halomonas korlensis]